MRKFIIRISSFIILLGGLFLLLEFIVFPYNKNPYTFKYNLLKNENKVAVIISGNSHLGFGIIADSLSFNAINIANKGRELETDVTILTKDLIKEKRELKAIVIPVSYYTLFKEIEHDNDYFSSQKRLYHNFYKIEEYSQGFWKDRLILNEPYRELFDDSFLVGVKKLKYSTKGWRANNTNFKFDDGDNGIKGKLKRLDEAIEDKEILERNLERLHTLIDFCSTEGIKLFLVLPPYSSAYFDISKGKYNKMISSVLRKVSENKSVVVVHGNDFMSTDIKYYENSDHLNVNGAKVFTKKVDSILKLSL